MELGIVLITYLAVVLTATLLFTYFQYTGFSIFVLALIAGFIFLNIAFPMTEKELDEVTLKTSLYVFIQVFTVIVLFVYAFITTISNRKSATKYPMKRLN